jgi:hypothetical protein
MGGAEWQGDDRRRNRHTKNRKLKEQSKIMQYTMQSITWEKREIIEKTVFDTVRTAKLKNS